MGLFDGPAIKFAQRFAEYLEGRAEQLRESLTTETDPYTKMRNAIVAEGLSEIAYALRTIVAE